VTPRLLTALAHHYLKLVVQGPRRTLHLVRFCHRRNHNKVTEVIQLICSKAMVLIAVKLGVNMELWADLVTNQLDKVTKAANTEATKRLETTITATANNVGDGAVTMDTRSCMSHVHGMLLPREAQGF